MTPVRYGQIGSLFFRPNRLSFGESHDGHAHLIDHVSSVTKGSVRVEAHNPDTGERMSGVFVAGDKFLVLADFWHLITPITPVAEWDCVFAQPSDPGNLTGLFHAERD